MLELFSLVKEKMDVVVQLRLEKHGDDNVNAYDARLSGIFSNSVMLKLHADLRDCFYKAAAQGDVEGFKKELRFPLITKPTPWDLEIPRTLLRLHDAHDSANDLVLGDGKTDNFVFAPMEGGSVKLWFRVKLAEMTEEQTAKLLRANGQKLAVSLECAPLEEKPDNFEQADLLAQEPHSEARKKADSMFDAPQTDMKLTTPGEFIDGEVVDAEFTPVAQAEQAPAVTEVAPKKPRGGKAKTNTEIE
jgi:hypothetical protein